MQASEGNLGFVDLGNDLRKHLLSVIKKDVDFLSSHGIMDYSLLLAIEKIEIKKNRSAFESTDAEIQSNDVGYLMSRKHCFINGDRAYHLALIDFL